jgi:hypothetical protein
MGFLSAFNKKPTAGERQQPAEKLSALIASYLQRLETRGGTLPERSMTLIARSPSAAIAQALVAQASEIERQQVSMRIVFARLAPFNTLAELVAALNLVRRRDGNTDIVRLIKTPALLHAHEQLVLGRSCCWTGDMLRRNEENRNGLDLWEEDADGSVRLAQFAFNAIWSIAKPVPARILTDGSRIMRERASMNPAVAAAGLAASGKALRRIAHAPITRH